MYSVLYASTNVRALKIFEKIQSPKMCVEFFFEICLSIQKCVVFTS